MSASSPSILALAGLMLCLSAQGCALTSKSDPVIMRYFAPESVSGATLKPTGAGRGLSLRLGRVGSAAYIRDRIAFREGTHEVGYYDELRWTERPEEYLRRAVSRSLFEEQGVQQLISRGGPTLEVELNAFEEVRAPKHVARVQITWMIRDEQAVQTQKSLTVERPIATSTPEAGPDAMAAAMADAIGEAVANVVTGTVAELSSRSSSESAARKSAAP